MDKNLQNIEDLFRKGLEDNEEMPSSKAWDEIDKKLDKDKVISIKKKFGYLKKVVFFLMFFLLGLSIYVWNNRDKNNLEKKNNDSLNKEAKINNNNNTLPAELNTITLKNSVDSLIINNSNHQNSVAENNHLNIDKNILKKQDKESGKTIKTVDTDKFSNSSILQKEIKSEKTTKSLVSDNLPNSPISEQYKKSKKTIKSVTTDNHLNSSISKQEKLVENNSNYNVKIKISDQIENENHVVVKPADAESNGTLQSLRQLNPVPITQIKNSTTNLIETKELSLATALTKANPTINNNDKSISKTVTTNPPIQSRFFITGFYSPDVSFSHLKGDQSGNLNVNTSKIDNSETETFSSTVGALLEYKLSRHWSLQSGLTLSTTNIDIHPETIYAEPDNSGVIKYKISTSSGDAYILPSFSNNPDMGDSIHSMSTTHTLQYLGIPLAIKYNIFSRRRFTLNAMSGLTANFLTRGTITTNLEKGNNNESETTNNIYGLKRFYVSGIAGIDLNYNVYKDLSVCFSPAFRFALNSINKDVPIKSFPNSLGFSLGLKIRL